MELRKNTPISHKGKKFFGNTKWSLSWRFETTILGGYCGISAVTTIIDVTYTMPRLANSENIDNQTRVAFDSYYSALLNHEKGHADSAILAAREIEDVLMGLKPERKCSDMHDSANQTANGIIDKYNKRDVEYDLQTNHGETQGVSAKKILLIAPTAQP